MQSRVVVSRPFQAVAPRRVVQVSASAVAAPVAIPQKAVDGSSKGTAQLALKVAGDDTANGLVHRYMVLVQQNARRGTASTLTRTEVRGGGKKPYAQKGTGNARRGSNTSPLFPGGGITFGPKPKDWSIKMNKKERRLALATALQSAAADMVVIDSLAGKVEDKKTKTLLSILEKVGADATERKVLLITKEANEHVTLAGRNVAKLFINTASAIKIFDVLRADHIVIEADALAHVQSFYGGASESA
uniref:Large ribosomal subunit protein uL4c n=1 Tax=Chlamydomonas leiostraca TaxID=1034604 RepID=A0A7S0WZE2_9CHLO|mmetsp:Transcript_4015/g.9989  ORF Transcript_4015/g.9989 Transcript_4015/m.9989 type:complete len:246 (+) Transcript_4015:22-759(+)|eukprot:CAMPEP_0202865096 /NCGR_PEP_ID=MMETSP1391-20130828/5244_1 /ASSEMBLY_ACC=CAM_ASM_000867 /TAXON_ID=1034604 /ORGANISM="Chlamydomonas leiostraca, Strain SAG 11-49" /LENGTH=245 /DNA_ID=CAMNT_0049544893 /DNA_START=18 /DNA_END=755 /DNA_ORIENTATION=-